MRRLLLLLATGGLLAVWAWAQDRPTFMGRELAEPMSHRGAPWLLRPTREAEERPAVLIAGMQLEPDHVVCDIGVGNGFHALRIAPEVREVIGVDIQPEMLALLRERAAAAGVDNVTPVLGTPTDPKLEAGQCDRLLLVDVYHEFGDPPAMLKALGTALAPEGEAVLVEFRANDPAVPIKPLHTMTKEQAVREWTAHGFRLDRTIDGLPWQHALVFRRDEASPEPAPSRGSAREASGG